MMTFLNFLFGGGLKSVDGILGRFFKNKDTAEANTHSEQMSAMQAMAAEFQYRENRTWFDSLVDGLNRLPRPLFAGLVIALLFWAPVDPISFAAAMQAYNLVPEWLALILAQIILLYVGGRMLDKWPSRLKGPSKKESKRE